MSVYCIKATLIFKGPILILCRGNEKQKLKKMNDWMLLTERIFCHKINKD